MNQDKKEEEGKSTFKDFKDYYNYMQNQMTKDVAKQFKRRKKLFGKGVLKNRGGTFKGIN
jgi:beta-N-acetylglucosaminidase|tara:strand:+ start:244 stop:423 length:180 start_codon:yes stop_codon:yes gene_type:complete